MNKIKKVVNFGTSLGVILPKMFLSMLDITKDSEVQVIFDQKKKCIIIKKK